MERAIVNRRLHAVSVVICGDRTVLDSFLKEHNVVSTTDLTDKQAHTILIEMQKMAKQASKNLLHAKAIISNGDVMSSGQRGAILKITKYKFGWSKGATFSFILGVAPRLREKLSRHEIRESRMSSLLDCLTRDEADRVIKKLDMIQKRNEEKRG